MSLIGVTEKLKVKLKIITDQEKLTEKGNLYSWHAHYFLWQRKPCVLFVNNLTRYSVVLYGLKPSDMNIFEGIFLGQLERNLINDGVDGQVVIRYIKDLKPVVFTKTSNRSVLGTINDFFISMSYDVEDYLNDMIFSLDGLNIRVNDYITLALDKVNLPPHPRDGVCQ
jgi:hypothetical protein